MICCISQTNLKLCKTLKISPNRNNRPQNKSKTNSKLAQLTRLFQDKPNFHLMFRLEDILFDLFLMVLVYLNPFKAQLLYP